MEVPQKLCPYRARDNARDLKRVRVPGWNFCRNTNSPETIFRGFRQTLQVNAG